MNTPARTTCHSVLIVDDDAAIRETMTDVLEMDGFHVSSVANGREALRYLMTAPRPCMILCDLRMPLMDGGDFCRHKHAASDFRGIPTIVVSGEAHLEKLRARLRVTSCLAKPVNIPKLLWILHQFCRSGPCNALCARTAPA